MTDTQPVADVSERTYGEYDLTATEIAEACERHRGVLAIAAAACIRDQVSVIEAERAAGARKAVEALRPWLREAHKSDCEWKLDAEAAAEIERLRAALGEILELVESVDSAANLHAPEITRIAEAALAEDG